MESVYDLIYTWRTGLCGLMASIGGVVLTARVRMAASTAGITYELYAIAAAVVGGASLSGARGTILGAVLGALIMTTIASGGNLLGINAFALQIAIGALIVIAVWIDRVRKGKSTDYSTRQPKSVTTPVWMVLANRMTLGTSGNMTENQNAHASVKGAEPGLTPIMS